MDLLQAAAQDIDLNAAQIAAPQAIEKLAGLSDVQLSELSRNVHDELLRRNFVTDATSGHNSRPQAAGKLARLNYSQLSELSRDVHDELVRRKSVAAAASGQESESQVPAFLPTGRPLSPQEKSGAAEDGYIIGR